MERGQRFGEGGLELRLESFYPFGEFGGLEERVCVELGLVRV